MQPSIEVSLGIEGPLDDSVAMNVAHHLSEIVSQSGNLGVEIRGQSMQVGMAFAEGGVISGAISAPFSPPPPIARSAGFPAALVHLLAALAGIIRDPG